MQKNFIVIFIIKYANYRTKCIFKSGNLEAERQKTTARAKQSCLYMQYFFYII